MSFEDQHTDRKSLRTITGKNADWDALARDCVCFANGAGGRLLIGIEDGAALPPDGLGGGGQIRPKSQPFA